MTRTMVYLPEELHRGLKHLAVERDTSMTELIREAVEVLYREDLEDLEIGRKRWREVLTQPHRARRSERTYKRL